MWEKWERLVKIAQEDLSYQTWSKCYMDAQQNFEAYVNSQPPEIQDILRGYADGGRFMYQRLANLACEYMDFSE